MKSKVALLGIACAIGISTLTSCKKGSSILPGGDDDEYITGWTRVISVKGIDTSSTKYAGGRIQTVGIVVVEDATLKAELMSYTPLPEGMGKYEIKVTNKVECQRILRWGWENLSPVVSIEPTDNTAGTPQSDVIQGNQVKTYIMIAKAAVGRIKVKADKSNSDCDNSSTLIINITVTILPIELTNFTRERKGKDVYVTFSTETPQDVDTFYVMWSPDGNKANEKIVAFIDSDHSTKNYKLSYPAIRKESLK